MTYATDGKCHNANRGTFNHECGKPATWIGTRKVNQHQSGFCDDCKEHGDEAWGYTGWHRIATQQPQEAHTELTPIGEQYIIPGCEKRHDKARKATQLGLWD